MKENSIIKDKYIYWNQFLSPKLDLSSHKKHSFIQKYISCGSAALGQLTNIPPEKVEKFIKNPKKGWHTGNAIKFLESKGYGVIELAKEDILKSDWFSRPLKSDHCLLINLRCDSSENTMIILHKNIMWHHYKEEIRFNNLFFLNKPTQDVLLVYHKKWKYNSF